MKKTTIIALILVCQAFIMRGNAGDSCSHVDKNFIASHLPLSRFEVILKKPRRDLCEVIIKIRNQIASLYAGRDFVVSGSMYQNKNIVTEDSINKIRLANLKKNLPMVNQAVAFTYRPEKKSGIKMYMFTDPLCPYCNKIEERVRTMSDKYGVDIHVLLITVHGKRGKEKCVEAVCRDFTYSDYHSPEWKKAVPSVKDQCKRGKVVYTLADSVSDNLFVTGVPAFYLDDGTFVSGADMGTLEAALERISKSKSSK